MSDSTSHLPTTYTMLSTKKVVFLPVLWDHPDSVHLRTTQQTEMTTIGVLVSIWPRRGAFMSDAGLFSAGCLENTRGQTTVFVMKSGLEVLYRDCGLANMPVLRVNVSCFV
jgi:hypothetical protein